MKNAALFVFAAAAMTFVAASADPNQDLVDGMVKCGAIADNTARLTCYDALNPTVQAARAAPPPSAPPAPAAAPPADNRAWYDPTRMFGTSPQRAQTTPKQFGSDNLPKPAPGAGAPGEPEEIDSISAGVADYSFNPFGRFLVVLDNGQIWQQLEDDSGRARFDRNGQNTVTINRGALGSYLLTVNDLSAAFKVRRLK